MTRDKAETFLRDLEERGEVTAAEGKKLLNELMEKGEQEKVVFQDTIRNSVDEIMKSFGYINKEEYTSLEERVKELEMRLGNSTSEPEG
jgi:polyhydroxyalkanoate synthesis regulator phasin